MSTQFTPEEVKRLAGLARITLTDAEVAKMSTSLNVINDAIAKVSEVAGDDVPITSHPIPIGTVLREDVPATLDDQVHPLLSVAEAIAGAPDAVDNQFKTPAIIGED